jgi:hypothetical protein
MSGAGAAPDNEDDMSEETTNENAAAPAEAAQATDSMPEPDLTNARPALPTYRSHKVVQAGKVVRIEPIEIGGAILALEAAGPEGGVGAIEVKVDADYMTKHQPQVGGWFVVYADGYQSWSPAEAFESGYRPAGEGGVPSPFLSLEAENDALRAEVLDLRARVEQLTAGTMQQQSIDPPALQDEEPVETVKRTIRSHAVNEANEQLQIEVLDEPGSTGASHLYRVRGFNTASNPSDPFVARHGEPARYATLLFQNGPIGEVGVNGLTHEVLLAILADRFECFQAGPHACDENALALRYVNEARRWLEQRTRRRQQAGVEGTHQGA